MKQLNYFLSAFILLIVISSSSQIRGQAASDDDLLLLYEEPDTLWTYKQVNGKDLQMAVFLPEDYESGKEFPTIVFFHGGSWRNGLVSWHYPDCVYWSNRGMIAASVDYRLKDRDNIEVPLECVKDAKSSIRFLRKNAVSLKIDTGNIVTGGGSAGGQLAAALATIRSEDSNDNCYDISISCIPNAMVLYNPYLKCKEKLSPLFHITRGLPPAITFIGDEDPIITVEEMLEFHNALKHNGNSSELYIGKGGKHGFCVGFISENPFFYWSLDLVDQFLVKHGILNGESMVDVPAGVKRLQADDYDVYR